MSELKPKKKKLTKKEWEEKQKIVHATIIWGVIVFVLGVLFYEFAFLPMLFQADVSVSFGGRSDTVFSGGGTIEGILQTQDVIAGSGISTEEDVIVVILGWVNFALPFAGLFAFVGIVYAGFLYVANFGNEELTGKAKGIIVAAIIGLVLIFSAYAIVSTVIEASTA